MQALSTVFLLMAEFGTGDIPLEDVAAKYLALDRQKAFRAAATQALPFPVYRVGSQKSPWLVKVTDLAEYLDDARRKAAKEWAAMHSSPKD